MLLVTAVVSLVELRRPALAGEADRWLNVPVGMLLAVVQPFTVPHLMHLISAEPLIDGAQLPFWAGFLLFVLVMDFGEYLFHRAQHVIPFLWRMHELHHSDPNMTATTAQRHFWGDPVVKAMTIWPAAAAIVTPTSTMAMAYAGICLWHIVVHANLRLDLGSWSWVINSPAYHRRHHSSEAAHFNSNFASLFPIFDVLCGSYRKPTGFPETGLPERPNGFIAAATWPFRRRSRDTAHPVGAEA